MEVAFLGEGQVFRLVSLMILPVEAHAVITQAASEG